MNRKKVTWAIGLIQKILQREYALESLPTWGEISIFLNHFGEIYLSINTTATSGGLPKVSYIKAMDIWFFACQIFTFISLIEYAQGIIANVQYWTSRVSHELDCSFQWQTVNVYLRQQKLHDIKVSKAKMTIEEKETVSFHIQSSSHVPQPILI